MDELLAAGARLDGAAPRRPPARFAAIDHGHTDVVRRLLPMVADVDGDGAMHMHVFGSRRGPADIAIVRLLLERGAARFNGAIRNAIAVAAEGAGDAELAERFRSAP